MPSTQVDVSIVLTSWNVRDLLRDCLHSVYEKTAGLTYEIIVVDDGSTDGTREMVQREFPEVTLIVLGKNVGFVKANNHGVQVAAGKYVLLLNTDTLLVNNAIKILVDFLETHPEAGACGGWLRNPDMTSQISFGDFPSFHQAVVDAFFLNDFFPKARLPNRGKYPDDSITEPVEVDYVTGADILIRKDLIDRIGLFDEYFRAYCEETEFCYRVKHQVKKKVYFVPEAQIIHLGGMSYQKYHRYQIQLMYSSYNKFLRKHHGRVYSFATRTLYAWHYFVKMTVRLMHYLFALSHEREVKRNNFLNACYSFRYSLLPTEQFGSR
jgi:GT2 family glycosyltransferase